MYPTYNGKLRIIQLTFQYYVCLLICRNSLSAYISIQTSFLFIYNTYITNDHAVYSMLYLEYKPLYAFMFAIGTFNRVSEY